MKKTPITIYYRTEFMGNIGRIEANLIEHGRMRYAQYTAAPYVTFVPVGKRKPCRIISTSSEFLLVLHGHGHPAPDSMLVAWPESSSRFVNASRGRYTSFDKRWVTDFNRLINPHLAARPGVVLLDARFTTSADLAEVAPGHPSLREASAAPTA